MVQHTNTLSTHQNGHIGMTNNVDWSEPKTSALADVAAAQRSMEAKLGWFADPLCEYMNKALT